MIANFRPNSSFTICERFLAEKLLELFLNKTVDSHRAKLNNPKWVLIELYQILDDWRQGKIKAFEKTVKPVILESLRFMDIDDTLDFSKVGKKYLKELLGSASETNYQLLFHAIKILLDENGAIYSVTLFSEIEAEINSLNSGDFEVHQLEQLNTLLDYLATELINRGFSKGFLYYITSKIFSDQKNWRFHEAFLEFQKCINREEEEFTVIFRLNKLGGGDKKIDIKSEFELDDKKISELAAINEKSASFFSKAGEFSYFLAIATKGLDYLSVIERAKKNLFSLIDFIHMGYPDNPFDFSKKCLVIGTRKRELTNIQPVFYIPDGNYKNNEELYELLLNKMQRVTANSNIQKETKQKIVSAFRHLRLGRDAHELEKKFLNYWIGLEYVFSNYDVNDTTIIRLKEYFLHAHSITYLKRNLTVFHNDIKRLRLDSAIPNIHDNLEYLKLESTYDYIISEFFEPYPLLAYRAYGYKLLINKTKKISDEIIKHRKNLEWHLTRCYRIRNEIVHDAAIHLNIESITGNLKYYLTYILTGLIEYLDSVRPNPNRDGLITINDYFLTQEIKYMSLKSNGFNLDELMSEENVANIFSI